VYAEPVIFEHRARRRKEMAMTLEEFQSIARSKTVERGKKPEPYTPEQRTFALDYVAKERARGRSTSSVVSELGIAFQTLRSWQSPGDVGRKALRAVSIEAASIRGVRGVCVVTPRGYRVEGLSVDDAAALLERLR
jgi:transposase